MFSSPYRNYGRMGQRNKWYLEAFFYAVLHNSAHDIECLASIKVDIDVRNQSNQTPLHLAVSENSGESHFEVIEALLKNGSNVNAMDDGGNTALHHLVQADATLRMVQLLLKYKPDLEIKNRKGETSLMCAFFNHDLKLIRLLLDHGSDVNSFDARKLSPLHRAALGYCGHVDDSQYELVELLLESGAKVNARDKEGKTPLHHLSLSKSLKTFQLLLDFEADINIEDNAGEIAAVKAVREGKFEIVKFFVERAGVDANRVNSKDGSTLLHQATLNANQFEVNKIIKFLLKNGANMNARDSRGRTPLMCMLHAMHLDYDKERGRNINFAKFELFFLLKYSDIGVTDVEGKSIVHYFDKSQNNWKFMVEHVAKQLVLDTHPVPSNVIDDIKKCDEYNVYFEDCKDELAEAKRVKVQDTEVTFFDLLVADKRRIKNYSGDRDLMADFDKAKLDCPIRFPIYGASIVNNVKKGIKRRILFEKTAELLSESLPIFENPNLKIVRDVLGFLALKDSVKMIGESDCYHLMQQNNCIFY